MGISYVGGQVGGRAGSVSTTDITYALTGGIEAAPRRGDFIVITVVVASQARNPDCAITVPSTYGAWSQLTQLNEAGVTYDTSLRVSYKFQAEYLDTTFQLPSTGDVADAQSYTVQVWRGVSPAQAFDVAAASATGTATSRPNPASITPTTSGAYVLICGGGAATTGASYTAPANYATNFLTGTTADTNDAMVGSGYRSWTSGAEDPAVYTGGSNTANDSWCCYTLALRPEVGGTLRGIEMGNPHNTNYLTIPSGFPDISVGVLITGWFKQMTPPAYPYSFGNRYPFGIGGTDWNIICIGGNMATSNTSATDAAVNHNITLWGTGGDSLGIIHERVAEAPFLDWMFCAWQFVMNGTDGFIMRQWLKVGATAPYIIREFTMTLAETRTRVGDAGFNFSAITAFGIGGHPAGSGDPEPHTLTRVRIYQTGTKPTEAELTAIAFTAGYDTSAWADYPLTWQDGVGDFTDHSGNSRPTLTQTGFVVGGHAVSTVPVAGTGKFVVVQSPRHVIQNATGSNVVIEFETLPTAGNLITIEGGITNGTPTATDSESNALTIRYSSPSGSNYRPFIGYIVMPSGASAPYSITVTGMSAGATSRGRAYEWQGNDATPEDWYKTSTTVAEPLTLTADSADTRAGTLVISSFQATTPWSDWPITPPADWYLAACSSTSEGTNNTGPTGYAQDISSGGQSVHRIFPSIGTETITIPSQSTANNLTAVMVGFKPAAESSGSVPVVWLTA